MSDAIVRDILQGWKRPLDTAARAQAAAHGHELHEEDAPLTYKVGDMHVVVARPPWASAEEHGAAVGATAEEAANKLLALLTEPSRPTPLEAPDEHSVHHETAEDAGAGATDSVSLDAEEPFAPDTAVAYSGVALVHDEIGALRNHVLMRIAQEKLLRLDANADDSRRAFLRQAASDYHNLESMKLTPTEQQVANYADYLELENFEHDINAYAMSLERAALAADLPMLQAMAVNPWTAG
jgi:hypothetical protein